MAEILPEHENVNDKVRSIIDAWKPKLLDLSKRNRSLNFKPNKVSTVTMLDEKSVEVFRLLCVEGKTLGFKPKPESENKEEKTAEHGEKTKFDNANLNKLNDVEKSRLNSPISSEFKSVSSASREIQKRNYLLTKADRDKLDKSLRRIEQQSQLSFEEQGVNSLFLTLGMLEYNESKDSEKFYKAPLIFVPVKLIRKSARTFALKASDDEVITNFSLAEYLKQNYSIEFPEMPDFQENSEKFDLQDFFSEIEKLFEGEKGWKIKDEIQLGLFSFQKIVMYKDLEKNEDKLASHEIIHKIINRSGNHFAGLPQDVHEMNLDKGFAPEDTNQIVDADSSQLRAIAAVSRNHNLVLEGPPGTGKSQTITNLIAQALSERKTVLFAAEKMAALEVVYRRLVNEGLGEFCLELHSTKANKRSVMEKIRNTLDSSLEDIPVPQEAREKLPRIRQELTDYIKAVHDPYGELNKKPFEIYGELQKFLDAPKAHLKKDILGYTQEQIDEALRHSKDITSIVNNDIGSPKNHPWRDAAKTYYAANDLDKIKRLGEDLIKDLNEIINQSESIKNAFGLPGIHKLSPEALHFIKDGNHLNKLKTRIEKNFNPQIFEQDPSDDIAFIEQKASGFFSFLAFLNSRYRSIKKRWLAYRLSKFKASLIDQANEMKLVSEYLRESKRLESKASEGSQFFGEFWKGENSNWEELENYISWDTDFRRLCIEHKLREQAFSAASQKKPDMTAVEQLKSLVDKTKSQLVKFCNLVGFDDGYFDNKAVLEIQKRVGELTQNIGLAQRWAAFEGVRKKVEKSVIGELLPKAMNEEISFGDLERIFLRAFYQQWLDQVVQEKEELRSFNTLTHEQRVKEFRKLDKQVFIDKRKNLVSRLRNNLQNQLRTDEKIKKGMKFLRTQLEKQRGLAPLRITMKRSLSAICAIKPCFMMSPLSVAQFLDANEVSFDLVIFDEASQLLTEDAVGTILRGKQLVVVGDPKQLPPTNFFAIQTGQANEELDKDGLPLYDDYESILEEVMAAGVPRARLKWHYRSAHESLITFSNVNFYDADLYTFPSVETDSQELGLHFEYVEDGVYEGRGLNQIEARRVADEVVKHFKQKPELTLGVGTFNSRQQIAIQDILEEKRREDQSIESFFDRSVEEPFFVKNLENIQGDERDVILLSVTYAKGNNGIMRYRLGPINGENGWRRLNVLTTRSRKLMRVFSSIRSDDINLASTDSDGARLLKEFLTYAEHKRLDSTKSAARAETESPFERAVMQELQRKNYKVIPQVGDCGYRIDLGIQDDEIPGRFICGIECDGVAYHSSQTARDRDRLRQQVLESRGWDIHRIWSTDWFKDRAGQMERIVKLIEKSKEVAKNGREAEKENFNSEKDEINTEVEQAFNELSDSKTDNKSFFTDEYKRPQAEPYQMVPNEQVYWDDSLLDAEMSDLTEAIMEVVEVEAPIHIKDLTIRVAAMWGQRTGKNIITRIKKCIREEVSSVLQKGEYIWRADEEFRVRTRNEVNIPVERIAPEEVQEAILMVLRKEKEFTRKELINEVRAVFGFKQTGASLRKKIDSGIKDLFKLEKIGEGGIGVALRKSA